MAGFAAYNQDILDAVSENMPIALMFILISSYVLIFQVDCNFTSKGTSNEHLVC